MTQLSLDRAPEAGDTLICGLTPSGRIDVRPGLTGAPRGVVDCQGVHAPPIGFVDVTQQVTLVQLSYR